MAGYMLILSTPDATLRFTIAGLVQDSHQNDVTFGTKSTSIFREYGRIEPELYRHPLYKGFNKTINCQ
jgi:hypothetical protein